MATSANTVVHVTTHPRWILPVSLALGVIGVGGALVGYGAFDSVTPNKTVGYAAWATCVVALAAMAAIRAFTKRALIIDDDGIEIRARGGDATRIRWSEPHDFYYLAVDGSATPAADKASVRTSDGRRIDVTPIPVPDKPNVHVPKLVDQYSTKATWPRIQARLHTGEDIEFGVIRLNDKRIEVGSQAYATEPPVSLQVEKGHLQVGADGSWTASGISILDVANYACLLKAIGQATQARPPG